MEMDCARCASAAGSKREAGPGKQRLRVAGGAETGRRLDTAKNQPDEIDAQHFHSGERSARVHHQSPTDVESQRAYVAGAGLSMSDGRCLTAVGSFAPLSVKDLAQKANLNKAQASRAAQSLVEQGLVLKTASPTDGRGVVLTLTSQGKAAWQRAMDVVGQRNKDIFGALSPAEQRQLSDFFDRLIDDARSGGDLAEAAEDQVSGETT